MRSTPLLASFLLLASTAIAADPSGTRPSWDDSKVVGSPEPPPPFKTSRAFPRLTVKQPLSMTPEPGTDRLLVLEHLNYWAGPGRLIAIKDAPDVAESAKLLDIDGLAIGIAFHPKYRDNGYLYVGLTGVIDGKNHTHVRRYTVDHKAGGTIDPASKQVVIAWPSNGHDGGDVAFGNDGYLYVSTGDGSGDSDGNNSGQDPSDLQASMLRIDVDHPDPGKNYSSPKDNPFVGRAGYRPELWCYGLRNPWRISFDAESGQLWAGNNGQDLWEQTYLIKKGANYGWSVAEGSHPFLHQRKAGLEPISPPTTEHPHSEARSLTGGRVYRGKRFPELVGAYVYGDWSTGRVWGVKHDDQKVVWHRLLADTPFNITGFGTDHAGEMYVIDEVSGFYAFEPTTESDRQARPFPTRLSRTGIFASTAPLLANPAVLPYQVNAPQWADGARIERLAGIAHTDRIEQRSQKNAGGSWTLPNGSVLVQTLSLDVVDKSGKASPKKVETRLLAREQGEWIGYSYRWNADQTDAELVGDSGDGEEYEVLDPSAPGGRRDQPWKFPSRAECMSCHSRAVGFTLGFTPHQLDRDVKVGGSEVNQLAEFERIGLFKDPLPARESDRKRMVDPYDVKAPLEARARSYLEVNCATCHVGAGGGNAKIDLGFGNSLEGMHLVGEKPVHSSLGIDDARLVAPGDPSKSIVYARITRRGGDQMPPLVSTEMDKEGVRMIAEWIKSLTPEPKK